MNANTKALASFEPVPCSNQGKLAMGEESSDETEDKEGLQ